MQIELYYGFGKDLNSTKLPDSSGDLVDVKLKENVSIYEPIFILTLQNPNEQPSYARWNFFFYFVVDIVFINNKQYEMHCQIDDLGTYRNDVLNSTQFVTRSFSNSNPLVPDNRVMPLGNIITSQTETNLEFLNHETVILSVIGKTNNVSEGVNRYAVGAATMKNILNKLYDYSASGPFSDLELYNNALNQAIFNPTNYVIAATMFPLDLDHCQSGNFENIFFGTYDSGISCSRAASGFTDSGTISTPARYYNDWRDFDDTFTRFKICIPGYGNVTLPSKNVYAGLKYELFLDLKNGTATYLIKDLAGSHIYARVQAQYGTEIQIGGTTASTDTISNAWDNFLLQVGGVFGGLASGFGFETDVYKESVQDVVNASFQEIPSTVGSAGSVLEIALFHKIVVSREVSTSSNQPVFTEGLPLCEYKQLSTLTGFCQCSNPYLSNNVAPTQIKRSILAKLSSGIIIE